MDDNLITEDTDDELPMFELGSDISDLAELEVEAENVFYPIRLGRRIPILVSDDDEPMRGDANEVAPPDEEIVSDEEPVIVSNNEAAKTIPTEEVAKAAKDDCCETEKDSKLNTSSEEEALMCSICFEPWTSSGEHRLVSLRCGHLFGKRCIIKWVKMRDSKCPQCNARARKSEIRPIYAKTIKSLDTTERDWAVKELERESAIRRKLELESARRKLETDMLRIEVDKLKRNLMEVQGQLREARAGGKGLGAQPFKSNQHPFRLEKCLDMKFGGSRVMDCSSILGILAVAHQSTNSLFPGYGLRKISVPDITLTEFVHLHQKQIRDVSFHSSDGLILTASLDKTVKITNCITNSVVQNYSLDCEVWSCCWDLDDQFYFYAGVRTGAVYVFDIRMTDRHLSQLPGFTDTSPVVSLQYLKSQTMATHSSKRGPIVGQLGSCCFYAKEMGATSFVPKPLPLEGNFTSLSCESTTGHLLASCRPSSKHPRVTHTLCELSCETGDFSCNFIHAMAGGSIQPQLSRSKLMIHPDNDSTVLVCAGDAEAKSTLVWNGCTGSLLDKLPAESPILDVTTFRWDEPILTTLTDKNLYFYKWNSV